jgi:hypothetical protein
MRDTQPSFFVFWDSIFLDCEAASPNLSANLSSPAD